MDWGGDSDDEEEEHADEEQEEGSRTRWILLDDANQYPGSILEDDDSVKVSVASSGASFSASQTERYVSTKFTTFLNPLQNL